MYILPLDAPDPLLAEVGGKALSLNRMVRAGLPVPPGFIVSTAAYHEFVAANHLDATILEQSRSVERADPASFENASRQIRRRFAAGRLPPPLHDAVAQAYQAHFGRGPTPVACRSSATAEDLATASFAGQQESFLNVVHEEALITAVIQCWSSLWTARAMAYRAHQGIAAEQVALAVVVQEMVPATAAGVLFTVNPVNGSRDEILINATWGLGEALVAGQVNPDTLVVDRADGRILQVQIGDKEIMTVPMAEGTVNLAVEPQQRRRGVLTPQQAAELARLGCRLEAQFGTAQDVEWALAGETLYLLQSRAVTSLPQTAPAPSPADLVPPGDDQWPPLADGDTHAFDLWTQTDVGERWPEPVTPLTWSTCEPMVNENMQELLTGLSGSLSSIRWTRRAYGHVYMNEGALVHAYASGYGLPVSMLTSSLPAAAQFPAEENRWRWQTTLRRLPTLLALLIRWERNSGKFPQTFAQVDQWVDEFMQREPVADRDGQLWAQAMTVWRQRLMIYMAYHAQITSMSMSSYAVVQDLAARWLGQKELVQSLIGGLDDVIAAEIVPGLQELARELRDLELDQILLEQPPRQALEQLRTTPGARPLLRNLEDFLQRHGHRCMSEAEWLYPRWREAPEQVIEILTGYLRSGMPARVERAASAPRQQREQAMALAESRLGALRRSYFRWSVARLQRLTRLRDNGQHYLVKLLLPMRHLYALLGKRWAERGWLANADDFFFLVVPEIEAVLETGDPRRAGLDLAGRAAARRQAFQFWHSVPTPEALGQDGRPITLSPQPAGGVADEILQGLAASQGTVHGVARVILSPGEASRLQPGDILVTRATDPGWTPLFSVARGIVLEIGGQLSHGAIVAREYGLPAVVNVAGATRRILDGQTITVDGTAGRVYLSWTG